MQKAEGVLVLKDIEAMAVRTGEASAADGANGACPAGRGPRAIALRELRIVDPGDALLVDIADGRWKFSAGMDLAVSEERHEIECRAASVAGAAAEGCATMVPADDIDEVVLNPHDGVRFGGLEI